MREGRFEDASIDRMYLNVYQMEFADSNWLLCRLQSWLWSNRDQFGDDLSELESLARLLAEQRGPSDVWSGACSDRECSVCQRMESS
jgi:hypothetical protein